MKTRLNRFIKSVTAGAVVAAFAVSAQGKLLVTEFMANPSGTDADREWIEIFNLSESALSLDGYKVGDEETKPGDEGMYSFPAGTTIAPFQTYVIAVKATGFYALYGKNPDFETSLDTDSAVPNMTQYTAWGTGLIALNNTGDHALIVDPFDNIVDGANHGDVTKFFTGAPTLADNQSYERISPVDTDTAADWVVRTTGNATPGFTSIPEPSALALGLLAASLLVIRRRV
ncbi:MAG TPA: lamin tail domain-containing protein [Candidatus Paceibacterota bacterium]|nr:lamin tail domain-containing protein [Verrucomicrobiota bacterium]HSA12995.1 lamin tail domain-containing protein [Candidatus Paceibacterota bacterium]